MKIDTKDLRGWTSDELLDEVLMRSAEDKPALRVAAEKVLGARLAAADRSVTAARES